MSECSVSIAQQISTELNRELAGRKGESIAVVVEGGCVNLYGFVSTIEDRNRAGDIARRFSPVSDVRNHISVNLF